MADQRQTLLEVTDALSSSVWTFRIEIHAAFVNDVHHRESVPAISGLPSRALALLWADVVLSSQPHVESLSAKKLGEKDSNLHLRFQSMLTRRSR